MEREKKENVGDERWMKKLKEILGYRSIRKFNLRSQNGAGVASIIDCENFLFSKNEHKKIFRCLSEKEKNIFEFEIEIKSENVLSVNFYDINKDKLNFKIFKNSENEFIVSDQSKNLKSLKNSLDYVLKLDQLTNEYTNVIGWFNTFLECIHILMRSAKKLLDFDNRIFSKISDVQTFAVQMTNNLFKSLAVLRIPSLDKLKNIESYDDFIKNMDELADMINDLIDIIETHISNDDELKTKLFAPVFELFVKDAKSFVEMLESDEESFLADRYDKLLTSLESLDLFVKETKENVNTEITLDCDVKKVDKFVEKFNYILLEYCEILNELDEVVLNEYYHHESSKGTFSYMKSLIETYFDILIAKEMKRYLHGYHSDKTDFLIFSQTDYFKNKFSNRIKDNLDSFISSFNHNRNIEETMKGKTVDLVENENNYLKKIRDLRKKISDVISYNEENQLFSFEFVVSSMPIEICEKDLTNEIDKREDIRIINMAEQEKGKFLDDTNTKIKYIDQGIKKNNKNDVNKNNKECVYQTKENLDDESDQINNKIKTLNISISNMNIKPTNSNNQSNGYQNGDNNLRFKNKKRK